MFSSYFFRITGLFQNFITDVANIRISVNERAKQIRVGCNSSYTRIYTCIRDL